jgi:ketosteroid isomerase-like protein
MISQAAEKGLTNLFRRLTEGGPDLKAVDPSGVWLLHSAAAGGSSDIVGVLIEKGFDAAKADRFGWTPLHYAARDGRTEAARILIEKGAPLDSRTIMGQTAYNVALERKMDGVAALLAEKGADRSEIRFPILKGDYLGMTPPGDKAELFGLGIISSIWGIHSTAVFSPDGNEVYWAPMISYPGEIYSRGGLLVMKRIDGRWTPPSWASFSGPDVDDDVPFFSPDGKRIYFISRRPLPGEKDKGSEKIWFANRTATGWSTPQPLDPNVNSVDKHWEFSLDRGGNVYFGGQAADSLGTQDIYLARFSGEKYEKPVNMGKPINSAAGENTPFIAPDGSYLIFEREYDLWVSFRGKDGAWSEPVQLGPEVNSPSIELCPIVTADGNYLFFLSQRDGESHAYWVRADVIEKARPGNDERKAGDQEAEKQKVAQVISSVIGWAKNKDLELFYGSIANDEDYVSVTPTKRIIKRFEDVKQNVPFWMSPDFKYVRHELKDLEIKFARCGEVAWFFCLLDDINTYKGEPATWANTRWTGVLEKRHGRWVVVQQHFSFASDR